MKIALFLGAGASVPYGMPTTKDLLDKIWCGDLGFPRDDLLDFDRFPDIEHILSILDQLLVFMASPAGKLLGEFIRSAPDEEKFDKPSYLLAVKRFRTYIKDSQTSKEIIERLITQNYKWDASKNESAEKILRPLFELVRSNKGHITIFTTNYDTVIEEYCSQPDRNIECIDGFKPHAVKRTRVWDGKFIPQDDTFTTKVFLYKLHGSMNWLVGESGDPKPILHKHDTSVSDDTTRNMYIRPSLDAQYETTRKEPCATILCKFSQILPTFDACIVIGHSFRNFNISKNLIEFVKAGKILVLLSPTAVADFKGNALNEGAIHQSGSGRCGSLPHKVTLEFNGTYKDIYIISRKLDVDNINEIIGRIQSEIADAPSSREIDASERGVRS